MNFFEQELRKLIQSGTVLSDVSYAGRACYGNLGGDNRAKIQFVEIGISERYEGLRATILNRTEGQVDSILFRFADIWGSKNVDNKNFRNGIIPYIWTYNQKSEWYIYEPIKSDFKQLADSVNAYLNVFLDKSLVAEKKQQKESVTDKIRTAKKEPASKKAPSNKQEREL